MVSTRFAVARHHALRRYLKNQALVIAAVRGGNLRVLPCTLRLRAAVHLARAALTTFWISF
nr:hypothetical protein [Gammaproteobacteria bacterium]